MIAHITGVASRATEGCYSAWRALEDRGWEIRPFEHIDEVAIDAEQLVIGGVPNVVAALDQLGVVPPDVDYPAALRPFLLDPALAVNHDGLGSARSRSVANVREAHDRP